MLTESAMRAVGYFQDMLSTLRYTGRPAPKSRRCELPQMPNSQRFAMFAQTHCSSTPISDYNNLGGTLDSSLCSWHDTLFALP
jgi:hypothetical protein